MQSRQGTVVILGTGGTIAGTAAQGLDNVGYTAAQLGVEQLIQAVPALAGQALEAVQVAQLDSKDMDSAAWLRLAWHAEHHLARPEVQGVVVTHGTDTLEETAYFLQRVIAPAKPLVMTAAMRPVTAVMSDGPQNLLDAVTVARSAGASGVVAVLGGAVFSAQDLRKVHTYRIDAFSGGDAGPIAVVEEGCLRRFREWPVGTALGLDRLPADPARWAKVGILLSHAGVSGAVIDALCGQAGLRGIVVAGTGNGTVHRDLLPGLERAQRAGVVVWRASRCMAGAVIGDGPLPSAGVLSAVQARIELMLRLTAA
jgi:L-asparaginase